MKQKEWAKEMKDALSLHRAGRSSDALKRLSRLTRVSRGESKVSLSLWHEQQSRGLIAMVLEETGEAGRAARVHLKLAREHEGEANGHRHSALSALALAALCRLKEKKLAAGARLGGRALRLAEDLGERNALLKELEQRLEMQVGGPK
jgi:hypothetical protein